MTCLVTAMLPFLSNIQVKVPQLLLLLLNLSELIEVPTVYVLTPNSVLLLVTDVNNMIQSDDLMSTRQSSLMI